MKSRSLRRALLTALAFGLATPALAQPGPPPPPPGMPPLGAVDADGHHYGDARPDVMPDARPEWRGDHPGMPGQPMRGGYDEVGYQQARGDWLAECRRNHGNGNMVGGAIVGGVVGGVIGNRIAGRDNRVIGTVAGAAVGSIAGGAIGNAADRRSARDYCESYLERYTTWQGGGPGYGQGGYSYGYAPMTVMVPVMIVQDGGQRECITTVVTEEYVTESPRQPANRVMPRRMIRPRMPIYAPPPPPAPDKRVRTN